MIDPIRIAFEVACPARYAFEVWTAKIGQWWPADHTVSAEVTAWDPPGRLAYLWHLRRDRADATEVEIRFIERDDATTLVEIEHRGWERLGAEGEGWRDRNHDGWATLLPHYIAAVTRP